MRSKKGFTILEVIFAIGLIAFVGGGFLYAYCLFMNLNMMDNDIFIATNAINSELEELRGIRRFGTGTLTSDMLMFYDGSIFVVPNLSDSQGTISVNRLGTQLAQVLVGVSWTSKSKRAMNMQRQTAFYTIDE